MKAFAGHVKEFEVVYDAKKRNKRTSKTKWVKVVLQVPTTVHRQALSLARGLSRHMQFSGHRWLTVLDPHGPEMAVVRLAAAYTHANDVATRTKTPRDSVEAGRLLVALRIAARELKGEPVIR